jgi:predicted HD phosphohydrolase
MELSASNEPGGVDRRATTAATVQEIVDACLSMVGLPYDGEPVDQLEHALQCAELAAQERPNDDEYVVACLLHDIARAPAVSGIQYDAPDEHHGESGARWLTPRVGARVAWLAEQHVAAKRYLVTTDDAYRDRLSEVSLKTLEQQGGSMSEAEVSEFERHPDWREAVALRRIDDKGKVPELEVPDIDSYRGRLASVVAAHSN